MLKAVILAAGRGTRMGEVTATLPKPMVTVRGKPVLEWIIEGLRDKAGVRDFFLVVGWQGSVIRDHFGDGMGRGVQIAYGEQRVQDGTGRAPELAQAWVGDSPFFLSYGDILVDADEYAVIARSFQGVDGVISVREGEDLSKGGAVLLDPEDRMVDLIEKGAFATPPPNAYYNAGIYIFTPPIFEHTQALQKSARGEYELTDAVRAWVQNGARVQGVRLQRSWADVRDKVILEQLNHTTP